VSRASLSTPNGIKALEKAKSENSNHHYDCNQYQGSLGDDRSQAMQKEE
jgi:hypothetical protein